MYTIKLENGTKLENLKLNGNNFISETIIDDKVFKDNLGTVSIIDSEGNIEKLNNVKIIFTEILDKQSFVLLEKTKDELEKEELRQLLADLTETVLLGGI